MKKPDFTTWLKEHVEEIFTAALTAFFTALMFRVGLGMLFSILAGLACTYTVRLVLIRKMLASLSERVAGNRNEAP
ncbi:MAG: hypothetical protein WEB57_04800 [Pseudohongiellaceae bacterium]